MTSTPITTTDGRVLGVKGLATRLRILEGLGRALGSVRYRDISIKDVTWAAGMSAASFWDYFPDLESAVHALAALGQPLPPHVQRVMRLIELEDTAFGVRRDPQPDTRLELLSALIAAPAEGCEWTAQDARQAFENLGLEITAEHCDALLARLADRGELRPITATHWVRTEPAPADGESG